MARLERHFAEPSELEDENYYTGDEDSSKEEAEDEEDEVALESEPEESAEIEPVDPVESDPEEPVMEMEPEVSDVAENHKNI